MQTNDPHTTPLKIAGRYIVEKKLGHGGMGSVYSVNDKTNNQRMALKMLSPKAAQSRSLCALFEREFHTLSQLAHPRIIEVYDFGVDEAGPYYTMELLDGNDLKQMAPLSWREACKLLRDVASSLALLHSRRLLHRDISARNVRCTAQGRAKLIDFGAMVPFSTPTHLIGTPPFVAPEAYNRQPLDQRTDLYSLGALAYWLVTKRHAYWARTLDMLTDAWRSQPQGPSVFDPDIPKVFNDLVMSLLNLDRMARPFSAAEVVETLSACAELEPDDTIGIVQSYLTTPRLVGRNQIVTEMHKRILVLVGGYGGSTLLFEGQSGMGRSRLLSELVLEGRVTGTTVLTASQEDGRRGDYGVANAMIKQLLQVALEISLETVQPYFDALSPIFPILKKHLLANNLPKIDDESSEEMFSQVEITSSELPDNQYSTTTVDQGSPPEENELQVSVHPGNTSSLLRLSQHSLVPTSLIPVSQQQRPIVQEALRQWFLDISQRRRLVIAIDDVHRIDEPSLALFAALSLIKQGRNLFLAFTAEPQPPTTELTAFSVLSQSAERIELKPLDIEATEALLRSIFGHVPNVRILADRLHRLSLGNPRNIMQLAQHLLDKGVVRYHAGTWTLPEQLESNDLPRSSTDAFRSRIDKLSGDARDLAQTMALSPERRFSFRECMLLTEHANTARLTKNLERLIAAEILSSDGQHYTLSRSQWTPVLLERLTTEKERTFHLRLAQMYDTHDTDGYKLARHLLKAGDLEKGLDVLFDVLEIHHRNLMRNPSSNVDLVESLPSDWVDTHKTALRAVKSLNRPQRQEYILNFDLAVLSVDTIGDKTYLVQTLDQLYHDSGLGLYDELDSSLDDATRITKAMQLAQERFDGTSEWKRVLRPLEASVMLTILVSRTAASIVISYDYELLQQLPSLKPLIALSPRFDYVVQIVENVRNIIAAQYENAHRRLQEILELITLAEKTGVTESYDKIVKNAIKFTLGLIEAGQGRKSSLRWADQLDEDPRSQVGAWRIRMVNALRQGDTDQAEACKKMVELLHIQGTPSRFFDGNYLWLQLLAYSTADDLTGVNQSIIGLEKTAQRYPNWNPILIMARAEQHRIRGEHCSAMQEYEKALLLAKVGCHPVWPYLAASQLRTLLELGRIEECMQVANGYIAKSQENGLGYMVAYLKMPLALAEARMGEYKRAMERADSVIHEFKSMGMTGLNLGLAYETRALIAIEMKDDASFHLSCKCCADQYNAGRYPVLTIKYEKLISEARRNALQIPDELRLAVQQDILVSQNEANEVRALLAECRNHTEVVEKSLHLILERTGSKSGYLYLLKNDSLVLTADTGDDPLSEELVKELEQFLEKYTHLDDEMEETETLSVSSTIHSFLTDIRELEPLVLYLQDNNRTKAVGVAVVCYKQSDRSMPGYAFYEAIARCLVEAESLDMNDEGENR